MNGAHDLGGMHGFGPVEAEPDEPVFHAAWERDAFAATMGSFPLRRWSLDEFRLTIERQHPLDYLRRTYYEKWLAAMEELVVRHGLITAEELATGRSSAPPPPLSEPAYVPSFDEPPTARLYHPGERVRVANRHPEAHTRQPRYARGRHGVIVRHSGAEPLPERAAEGQSRPEHVYLVRFEASELWGPDAGGGHAVFLDLWESYLEPVA